MIVYLLIAIGIIFGYLFGSIPFALIIGKLFYKIDIRKHGSGNLGSTNVSRTMGKLPGAIVMILDIFKGGLPALIMYKISETILINNIEFNDSLHYLAIIYCLTGLFTAIGHCYSIFASFNGGKAVACICGFLLFMNIWFFLFGVLVYILGIVISKMVSVGSISSAFFTMIMTFIPWFNKCYLFTHNELDNTLTLWIYHITLVLMGILIILKHIPNIKRILNGSERKINNKNKN